MQSGAGTRLGHRLLPMAITGLALALFNPPQVHAQAQRLSTVSLDVQGYTVQAELADTETTRSYGLMHRQSLPPNHGMLFQFEAPSRPCFWMKNTPLPLSIAFISATGQIVNLADMQPNTEFPHCAAGAILYALEMPQGWFAERGIAAGHRIGGLPLPRH